MIFAKEFFDLQLTFAERVRALSGMPLDRTLLEYTNLYVRFGLGRLFDPRHETWRAYVAGLHTADDAREYTYRFYLRDAEATTAPAVLGTIGCFSWAFQGGQAVRLHFRNEEQGGSSPLSAARTDARRAELAELFAHVKSVAGNGAMVTGASWLYNIDAYRRLFPPAYGASRRVARARFQGMPLWGQFLNHRGQVKQTAARPFLSLLARQSTLCGVERCFPFQVLAAQAPIQHFYAFYCI